MNRRGSMINHCCLAMLVLLTAAQKPCRAATCSQDIPAELVRELWRKTKELIHSLPDEGSRGLRLLPVYCTNLSVCPQGLVWSEVGHVMRVYQKRVFRHDVIKKLLPLHFHELLHRLEETLQHCASSQKRSKEVNHFMNKVKKVLRRRRGEGVFKAVREFLFVLRWIDELRDMTGTGTGT